jgi:hypothetical protein
MKKRLAFIMGRWNHHENYSFKLTPSNHRGSLPKGIAALTNLTWPTHNRLTVCLSRSHCLGGDDCPGGLAMMRRSNFTRESRYILVYKPSASYFLSTKRIFAPCGQLLIAMYWGGLLVDPAITGGKSGARAPLSRLDRRLEAAILRLHVSVQ